MKRLLTRLSLGLALGGALLGLSGTSALADDWHHGGPGWDRHRPPEWHRHYVPPPVVYAPPPRAYYVPPPVVYAPPPVVAAPSGLNIVIPLTIR
jgi:hypothetical protein